MAGTSLPPLSATGLPRGPPPPSRGHHPHCRTLGSAKCQRGTKHPPLPSSSSSTTGALWEAGGSGNNKFTAKTSQEGPSSCESVTQSRSHTETPLTPKPQEHCIPGILTAAQPPLWSKQHPSGQAPTGTAPAPLGTPWHRGSSAVPLLQRAEHQHPCLGSGRGIQGQETGTAPAWLTTIHTWIHSPGGKN